ncbi:gliding motility-associated C-terminal domain-containing protein [Hymenobacter ruricola]|uniref:Gliding motility-associated C-terminal domain-containing protein n=1 Tax=Hymenobacter ruricola TaxID=2791023 RepID=A0ABS0I9L2_9BACT|nr:gliding motility-associated C-terminal domain-containing protein [Hymenobacter ruricola]MBF9223659.1 gliding motility-associated C-terminal domain-containing protein [Hymenobacter ruricola]
MRKIVHSFTLLLFACALLLGSAQEAHASHLLGGDMTYVSLGNNQYRVKFRLYRDCTGILPTPGDFVLECRNGGNATFPFCNVASSVSATFVQQGAVEAGNPFCAAASAGPCQGPTGLPNYDVYNFLATVTLPPGNWALSTFSNARPALANAVDGNLYVEATLDNRNQGTTAVANNSPQFDPQDIPIQYVCWTQPTTITYSSTEPDGDSLVYTLTDPLQGCGSPVTYKAFPGSAPFIGPIPGNPSCFFNFPGIPGGNYSATNPIRLGLDTVGTCPVKTGVPRTIRFNQQARTLSFTPGFLDTTPTGNNKYQIAVRITEYRRINGVRRIIGRVTREANIIVINCGNNSTPKPPEANPITVNSGTSTVNTADTTRIDVRSCNYSRVELNFTDPDNLKTPSANQILKVVLPANINTDPNLLDSGDVGTFSLSNNNTTNPRGVFFFQPSPNTVGRIIRLNIRVEDDACPIKGIQNRVVVIRIVKGNVATAAATVGSPGIGGATPPAICAGGSLTLQGNVQRPDSIRRIATNTTQAQQYSFQWSVAPGGSGLPAVTNTQNITVNPTVTTRYRLAIAPTLGFAQGSCGDTTSILVRVVGPPVVAIQRSLPQVCAGAAVNLVATASIPNAPTGVNDVYTYRWSGPGIPANTTGATLTVRPTTVGVNTYTVTATGASPYGCSATNTVQVTVTPPPTVRVTAASQFSCPGTPVVLSATATTSGIPDTYTFRFAPAPGLATADETKANPTVSPLVTTRYRVTASGNPATGCADTASVVVRVLPAVTARFNTADSLSITGQRTNRPPVVFTFNNTTLPTAANLGAGNSIAYTWTYQRIKDVLGTPVTEPATAFGNNLQNPGQLRLGIAGTYRIRMTATLSGSGNTCKTESYERLVIVPDLEVPNVITPNGDQQNDVFKVSTAGTNSKLEIYNRWGRKVYEQTNYQNNWGGDNQPAGVYYYLLTDKNGVATKGWIEVVR